MVETLSPSDVELFRGGVPQIADWLRAWRACRTPTSWHTAEEQSTTENFINSHRQMAIVRRKSVKAMVSIMADRVRSRKRRWISEATSITIGLDDRKDYRAMCFKCDARYVDGDDAHLGARFGSLGVLRRGGKPTEKTLEDINDDYSLAMAVSVITAIQRLSTSALTGVPDQDFVSMFCSKVRMGVADGGSSAQKALRFLAAGRVRGGSMSGMLLILRDPAHMVRCTTKDAVLAEPTFKAWWDDVFGERHALVPDIQNSGEWLEKLQVCQRLVLGSKGVMGGGMTVAQKAMSFAKQRFDSCASPQRQYCCMLVPIAMMLAFVASDTRLEKQTRDRACRRLVAMPDHVLTAGLSAAYSHETLVFVRLFDVLDHDPALTWEQKQDFAARMRFLFKEGGIFLDPGDGRGKTCVQIAMEQAKDAEPIYYRDGRVLLLHRKLSKADTWAAAERMHTVTEVMVRRLDVEINCDHMGVLFTAFSLKRWRSALQAAWDGHPEAMTLLQRHVRQLLLRWRMDVSVGVREFEAIAIELQRQESHRIGTKAELDNRIVWRRALNPDFARKHASSGAYIVMPGLIRIYLSCMEGTGNLERMLGQLKRILDAHSGPLAEDGATSADIFEVMIDGPQDELGVATLPDAMRGTDHDEHASQLLPTDFVRECGREWVQLHGRRFRVDRQGPKKPGPKKPGPRAKKQGTIRSIAQSVSRASAALWQQKKDTHNASEMTVVGVKRKYVAAAPGKKLDNSKLGDKFKKYMALSRRKALAVTSLKAAYATSASKDQNPYEVGALNPNKKLRQGSALRNGSGEIVCERLALKRGSQPTVVDCTREGVTGVAGFRVLRPTTIDEYTHAFGNADLVVWDDVWALDNQEPKTAFLKSAWCVVALGCAVCSKHSWECSSKDMPPCVDVCYRAAATTEKQTIIMESELRRLHPNLFELMVDSLQGVRECQWQVLPEHVDGVKNPVTLKSTGDLRAFLVSARRTQGQGLACSLLNQMGPKPAAKP